VFLERALDEACQVGLAKRIPSKSKWWLIDTEALYFCQDLAELKANRKYYDFRCGESLLGINGILCWKLGDNLNVASRQDTREVV
jgi:hypothetical protein